LPGHRSVVGRQRLVFEVAGFAVGLCGLRRKTGGDDTFCVVLGDGAGITGSVQRASTAEGPTVLVAVVTEAAVVGVLARRTFGHTVRTILDVLAPDAVCLRL